MLNICLFFQVMCYLTQGITEVFGRELRNQLFTHFRSLQATTFPTSIMLSKVANWATLSCTFNVLHWYKQYMTSSLHKWGYNIFIYKNQRSEYTFGSGTLWNTQGDDVLCRPILCINKNTTCVFVAHTND